MAKNKHKNFGLSEKLHAKKSNSKTKTKLNPFEVHINKEKYKVLGKKSKNDWGLPGVSRAKALKKRKNTIGHELKLVNKNNAFLDKRIGEKNYKLSNEERAMARFTAERIQQHKAKPIKQSLYNLAEEEVLTHRGQTLEEIEKFDDPRSDDENEEDDMHKNSGTLQDMFVADANFGGGVLSKRDSKDGALSRKELIEQLILDSKKRKIEKQKLKEETLDLTEKLDNEWKDLHPIVSKVFGKEIEKPKEEKPSSSIDKLLSNYEKKNEDYDKTMRELKFEPRGTPSDRLKSEDEIAKIEKEKLEKLEEDRLKRMQGKTGDNAKTTSNHKSADALDDNFAVDLSEDLAIVYDNEGNAIMNNKNEESGEEGSEKDESENEDSENENSNDEEEMDEDQDDSEDSLDDLKENNADISSDENEPENTTNVKEKSLSEKVCDNTTETNSQQIKADLLARKIVMDKAAAELPYTFQFPKDYDALYDLLSTHSPDQQGLIIERMIKCNHPKLGEENKKKLDTLFAYMLQYLNDLFSNDNINSEESILKSFQCFDRLASHYYDLAQMNPMNAKDCIVEVIKEKYEEYKKHHQKYPKLDTIIFFKLVSLLFPTSDLKHPVVTPCYIFLSNILSTCKVRQYSDIAKGLFLCTLVLEYVSLSKRVLPDAINFLKGVIFLSIPTDGNHNFNILHPFKRFGPASNLLVLKEVVSLFNDNWKLNSSDLIENSGTVRFYICSLVTSVKILNEFFKLSEELPAKEAMFIEHIKLIKAIPLQNYPEKVHRIINDVIVNYENCINKQELKPLIQQKKTKMLKLYEPAFDSEFNNRKKKNISKDKAEHERLVRKHKKEMKGALREIRRDKAYINSVTINDRIQRDNIRKDKVKHIFSEASLQQGELNALQRSKKKKNK